jgi:hypothetical protein
MLNYSYKVTRLFGRDKQPVGEHLSPNTVFQTLQRGGVQLGWADFKAQLSADQRIFKAKDGAIFKVWRQ